MYGEVELTIERKINSENPHIAFIPKKIMDRIGIDDSVEVNFKKEGDFSSLAVNELSTMNGENKENYSLLVSEDYINNNDIAVGETVKVGFSDLETADRVVFSKVNETKSNLTDTKSLVKLLKDDLKNDPVMEGLELAIYRGDYEGIILKISDVDPNENHLQKISEDTEFEIYNDGEETNHTIEKTSKITYEDIGGLNDEINSIREIVELPLKNSEAFNKVGIEPPKGVLLNGPPGTGKTLLAKAVANEVDAEFYNISGPEIVSKYYGESEEELRNIFEEAEEEAPAIIFFDEIDSITPSRDEASGDVEQRIVSQLLSLMDGLENRGDIVVLAATNMVDNMDPALRRGGRFDREINIGVPDEGGRREIFDIHTRGMPLSNDVDKEEIVSKMVGFVGADIESLVKEAGLNAINKQCEEDNIVISESKLENIIITQDDFNKALGEVEPNSMREWAIEAPDVTYEDIGGLDDIKNKIKEYIEWPISKSEYFEETNTESPKGILLYGPPGTGKTLMAKAVANESDANFININGPEIMNKYVGESEKTIREIFKKARSNAPSIVLFDEIDSITSSRSEASDNNVSERIVSQLLTELDGIEENENVKFIASTNRPDMIDNALLRAGRFEQLIETPMPSKEVRKEIFSIHTKDKPIYDLDIKKLAEKTEGYNGSDIKSICDKAMIDAIRDAIKNDIPPEDVTLNTKHILEVIEETTPSVDEDTIKMYHNIKNKINDLEQNNKQDPSKMYS